MEIDFNKKECEAMIAFLDGDYIKGRELQQEFICELRKSIRNGQDYCPCKDKNCKLHGNCFLCIQIHRGHGNHLPVCMQKMVNRKISCLSKITEHTVRDEIEKPPYL